MAGERRVLDESAIEKAETLRESGDVLRAAELAAVGIQLDALSLTAEEVAEILKNPRETAVLACLARIYVDSLKTAANQTMSPPKTLSLLEKITDVMQLVHTNPKVILTLKDVDKDHLGREHHFVSEINRDVAKTLSASAALLDLQKADALIAQGEELLQDTYNSLPFSHPTKPLIGIELELSRAARGENVNFVALADDFNELVERDRRTNPHRVATVASWLAIWGEKLHSIGIQGLGLEIFDQIIHEHQEWATMTEKEKQKMATRRIRQLFYRFATPLTTSKKRREQLYEKLREK